MDEEELRFLGNAAYALSKIKEAKDDAESIAILKEAMDMAYQMGMSRAAPPLCLFAGA